MLSPSGHMASIFLKYATILRIHEWFKENVSTSQNPWITLKTILWPPMTTHDSKPISLWYSIELQPERPLHGNHIPNTHCLIFLEGLRPVQWEFVLLYIEPGSKLQNPGEPKQVSTSGLEILKKTKNGAKTQRKIRPDVFKWLPKITWSRYYSKVFS